MLPLAENLNLTQPKQTCICNKMTQKELKPGLVASYDLQPGNGVDLF